MNALRYGLSAATIAALASCPGLAAAQRQIKLLTDIAPKVVLNGTPVTFTDATPGLNNGQLFLPVRTIAEQMGCSVQWDQGEKQVALNGGGNDTQFTALPQTYAYSMNQGEGRAERFAVRNYANLPVGQFEPNQVVLINDHAYMGYVQLANALHAVVQWDDATNTLTITSIQASSEVPTPDVTPTPPDVVPPDTTPPPSDTPPDTVPPSD